MASWSPEGGDTTDWVALPKGLEFGCVALQAVAHVVSSEVLQGKGTLGRVGSG